MQTTNSFTIQATPPEPVTAPPRRPEASIQLMLDLQDNPPAADNRGACHPPAAPSSTHGATQPTKNTPNPNMPDAVSNATGLLKTANKVMNSESLNPTGRANSAQKSMNVRPLDRRRLPKNMHVSATTPTQPMKTNQI